MDALESIKIESALAAQAKKQAEEDDVGQTDFLTMLVAQLENQDPLNPQDSAAFAAQLAQFSTVEQLVAMRAGIDKLVSISEGPADAPPTSAAAGLDPTNLVGKEVTVFGSQIEVDGTQSRIRMDYRSIDPATRADVTITDADGRVVHTESILPQLADGSTGYVRAGDHVFDFNPAEHNLPPGVYGIEFNASNAAGEPVTLLPMIQGTVTGAILAGEPSIRMGNRIFSVNDVLEVSLPNGGGVQGAPTGTQPRPATGGGQTIYRPTPLAGPTASGA